jgi:hypothetical protein
MPKQIITYCPDCSYNTNQTVVHKKRILSKLLNYPSKKSKTYEEYMTVQCLGCNTVSFVHRFIGKEFYDKENNRNYMEQNYPEKEIMQDVDLLSMEDQTKLPPQLRKLYEEIEIAYEYEANLLAGIGLRMLIEAICLNQKIEGANLKIKIERLHSNGFIAKNDIPILDKLREIGNTTAHEIKGFSNYKLKYALEIVNHVLKSIYILPTFQKKLAAKRSS